MSESYHSQYDSRKAKWHLCIYVIDCLLYASPGLLKQAAALSDREENIGTSGTTKYVG